MSISAPVRPPPQNSFTRRVLMQALAFESEWRRAKKFCSIGRKSHMLSTEERVA